MLLSVLIPALIALLVVVVAFRWMPAGVAERHGVGLAVAAAFFGGYWLLPEWAPLWPEQYWQWLPYLGLGAWLLGAVSGGRDVYVLERVAVYGLVASVTGLLIVPGWPDLDPSRTVYVLGLTLYLALLGMLLVQLPGGVPGTHFIVSLAIASLVTSVAVAVVVSVKLGQVGIIGASALVGSAAVCFFSPRSARPMATRNVALVYAVLVGGIAFVGHVNPVPPVRVILGFPAVPLLLWLTAVGPAARLGGWKAFGLRIGLVLLGLGACAVPLLWPSLR